jgi:hypothetical protein
MKPPQEMVQRKSFVCQSNCFLQHRIPLLARIFSGESQLREQRFL